MNPDLYHVFYDEEECICTFLLFNWIGKLVGYQQYRPNQFNKKQKNDPKTGRYYTYLPGRSYVGESADSRKIDVDGFWGAETIDKTKCNVFVVEGIFKAATLHRFGFNAIATLTATPKRLKPLFGILKTNFNLTAIGDPDSAGKQLVNIVGNGFQSPKDLDEMADENILTFLMDNMGSSMYNIRGNICYG